jgi:tetratricopeptide (TPR) repeat protein
MKNMAILAVRGAAREKAASLVEDRKGTPAGEHEGLPLFAFTSPTDAVLTGLSLAAGGACAAVTAGEVDLGDDEVSGRAAEAAVELASRGPGGEVVLVEAVYFAMNRNEVSAVLLDGELENSLEQRVYRAEVRQATPEPAPAPAPVETAGGGVPGWAAGVGGALLAVLAGFGLARSTLTPSGTELGRQAASLSRRGLHREASRAFLEAYLEDPGEATYERNFRKELLAAVEAYRAQGRPDAGYKLLQDGLRQDPFRSDLEEALLEVGMEYLAALLANDSKDAFELEKVRLIESLPLREQAIRDRVVGLHVKRVMERWRKEANNRKRSDIARETAALWEQSPENPDLHLAEAEIAAAAGRVESVISLLGRALKRHPEWAADRPEPGSLVMLSMESIDTAYYRKRYLDDLVGFVVQHFGEGLVEEARGALEAENAGSRAGSFEYLERVDRLTTQDRISYFTKVLQNVHSSDTREGPLKDDILVGAAVDFATGGPQEARGAMTKALRQAVGTPGISGPRKVQLEGALAQLEEAP